MIYHFLDRQFNSIVKVDTEAKNNIQLDNPIHTTILDPTKKTRLRELDMDIYKNTGPKSENYFISSQIQVGCYVVFLDDDGELACLTVMEIENEDEDVRSIHCEDLGMELINSSAAPFESNKEQYIEYYINRELFDTGWQIGINEIGTDIKRLGIFSDDETSLERLQKICALFNVEISFTIKFRNLKLYKKEVNIYRSLGTDRTDRKMYSGVDVVSMTKKTDIYNVVTALRDENNGFQDLVYDDGRFYTRAGESIVYDRETNSEYGRGNNSNETMSGWIMGVGASTGTSAMNNFSQLRNDLEALSEPNFSATVDMLFDGGDFRIGDWITFIDEDFNPSLRLKARIVKIEINKFNTRDNKIEISNYQLLDSKISSDLIALQKEMQKNKDVYQVLINPNNGNTFIEGQYKTTTLTLTVLKNGIDITNQIEPTDIVWTKQDANGVNDEVWEAENENATTQVVVDSDDFDEISMISCQVLFFENTLVRSIYFLNGIKDIARKAIKLQSPNTIISGHISDTHFATDSSTRDDLENYGRSINHVKNIVQLSNFIDLDYIVLNGDVHDGSTPNKDIAKRNYSAMVAELSNANCPYFISWGNHDDNSWGDGRNSGILKIPKAYKSTDPTNVTWHGRMRELFSHQEMYDIATRPSTIFDIVENPDDKLGYYYYDVPGKNNRVIILNTQDIPLMYDTDGYNKYSGIAVYGYRQKQITWFYNTLKNTPKGMHVSIYQHIGFGYRYSSTVSSVPWNYELIDGIIDSFVSGGTYTGSYSSNPDFKASISTDFGGNKGIITYLAHGHFHNDRISKAANGVVNYSIGCSVSRPKYEQKDRPLGALEEDLWDLVVTNTITRKVKLLRFGAGKEREFTY